jgi:hypothetical protein
MRLAGGDVRAAHIVSRKNDHGPSHRRYSFAAVEPFESQLSRDFQSRPISTLQQSLPNWDMTPIRP